MHGLVWIITGLAWTAAFFACALWSSRHSAGGRFSRTTYYPHVSHAISWAFVGVSVTALAIACAVNEGTIVNGGTIGMGLLAFWQLSTAGTLLLALHRREVKRM